MLIESRVTRSKCRKRLLYVVGPGVPKTVVAPRALCAHVETNFESFTLKSYCHSRLTGVRVSLGNGLVVIITVA